MRWRTRSLVKRTGTLAICLGLLCLVATSSWAVVPWYANDLLTYTPASPGAYNPVTFDWSAVTAEITRVTPCTWVLKNMSMRIYGPESYSVLRQGSSYCAQPWPLETGGEYSVTLTLSYATSIAVVASGNDYASFMHTCIAPAVVNVPERAAFGVRISDLAHSPLPPNPIRVWGKVTSESPLKISDGRVEIQINGQAASLGELVVVTGDWNGTALALENVSAPDVPSGNAAPGLNVSNTYSTSGAACSKNHEVEYSFNWGDGTSSPWSTSTTAWHAWNASGANAVTVAARCSVHPDLTETSAPLPVTVTEINSAAWECCDVVQLAALVESFHDTGILSGDDLYASLLYIISMVQECLAVNDPIEAGMWLGDLEMEVMDACISDQPPPTGILNTLDCPAGSALLADIGCIGQGLGTP